MSSLSRELVFLILQFLDEEKFKDSVHRYVPYVRSFINFYFIFVFNFLIYIVYVNL
jgi:hypothetical protein